MTTDLTEKLKSIFTRTFDVTTTPLYVFPGVDTVNKVLSTDDDPEDDNDFGWKYHEIAAMSAAVVRIDPSDANYSTAQIHIRCDGFSDRVGLDKVSEYASAAAAMPATSGDEGWIIVDKDNPATIYGVHNLQRLRMYRTSGSNVTVAVEVKSVLTPGKE